MEFLDAALECFSEHIHTQNTDNLRIFFCIIILHALSTHIEVISNVVMGNKTTMMFTISCLAACISLKTVYDKCKQIPLLFCQHLIIQIKSFSLRLLI